MKAIGARQYLPVSDPGCLVAFEAEKPLPGLMDLLVRVKAVAVNPVDTKVRASLGKPTRTSTKINAAGKQERLEYAMFEKVPQTTTTQNAFGQLVQTVIYVKVEVGTLSLSFKNGVVDEMEETKGNPLGGGGARVVPAPIIF